MSVKYNAFISYRHHPVDSRAAGEIQKALEHFYVPLATRKKTGVKKISRVFRDKEELPITSNLSDDIKQALASADFLIVICSPRTSQSVWVLREIKEFLRTHTRRQVLTVLAEGEPYESIPELLTREEYADPDTGELSSVALEPLSCDWRLPRRQALREELPRLASALLGCAYDDLRMRQRQYRTRRLVAAMSAALLAVTGLGLYYRHTSIVINENYLQALRNQSSYLASASLSLLDEGDRITAAQLAMAALPHDGADRPLVAQAEYALGQAIGAYAPPQRQNPKMVGAFVPNGKPKYFLADGNGMLYILSENNVFSAWDAYSFQSAANLTLDFKADKFFLAPGGLAVIWGADGIACCERDTGTLLWQLRCESCAGAILSADGDLITLDKSTVRVHSLLYGTLISELDVGQRVGEEITLSFPDGNSLSPDGALLALRAYSPELGYRVFLYEPDTESGVFLSQRFFGISDMIFSSPEKLTVLGRLREDKDAADFANSYFMTMTVTQQSEIDAVCLSVDGGVLWSSQISLCQASITERLFLCPDGATLLCMAGGTFARLDSANGSVLGWCECPGSIVSKISFDGESALAFLAGGELCIYTYETDVCSAVKYFPDELYWAHHGVDGSFYLSRYDSDRVLAYRYDSYDENWQGFSGQVESIYTMQTVTNGSLLAVFDMDRGLVHIYDVRQRSLVLSADVSDCAAAYSVNVIGFSPEGDRLLLFSSGSLLSLSVSGGGLEQYALPLSEMEICSNTVFVGERIVFALSKDDSTLLCSCDCWGGSAEYYPLSESGSLGYLHIFPGGTRLLCVSRSGSCIITEPGGSVNVSSALPGDAMTACWSPDGSTAAIVGREQIYLTDSSGAVILELALSGKTPLSCCFSPDGAQLLFVGTDAQLHRYGVDGRYLGSTKLPFDSVPAVSDAASSFRWGYDGEAELLLTYKGELLNISCAQWAVKAKVPQCIIYDSAAGEYISYSNSGRFSVGSFRKYSTDDLLIKADAFVGGIPLTDEARSAYGLTAD